jgi:hypothetical protein
MVYPWVYLSIARTTLAAQPMAIGRSQCHPGRSEEREAYRVGTARHVLARWSVLGGWRRNASS